MKPQQMVEVESLVAQGRQIQAISPTVRARVLTRARSAITLEAAVPVLRQRPRGATLYRAALVAAAMLVTGIAGAVAALHGWQRPPTAPAWVTPSAPPSSPVAPRAVALAPLEPVAPPPATVAEPLPSAAEPPRAPKPVTARESYAAELELLRRAQANYAAGNFSGSLVLLNAHARQFPNGRLAEECEALRVSCLNSLGRGNDARRAAASFATRFPHSVLLPRTLAVDPPAGH